MPLTSATLAEKLQPDYQLAPPCDRITLGRFVRGGRAVLLVVNVASQCGLTPQYEGLEQLHEKFRDRKFSVLGFPANDFGAQEPGSEQEVKSFCRLTYGVRFPMFEKTHAAEARADPLYRAFTADYLEVRRRGEPRVTRPTGRECPAWPTRVP